MAIRTAQARAVSLIREWTLTVDLYTSNQDGSTSSYDLFSQFVAPKGLIGQSVAYQVVDQTARPLARAQKPVKYKTFLQGRYYLLNRVVTSMLVFHSWCWCWGWTARWAPLGPHLDMPSHLWHTAPDNVSRAQQASRFALDSRAEEKDSPKVIVVRLL